MRSWIVGRDPTCDVVVADEFVSPRHCEVRRLSVGIFVVRDLGSVNGTWIRHEGRETRVRFEWVEFVPGMTLVVGRSLIPWNPPAEELTT